MTDNEYANSLLGKRVVARSNNEDDETIYGTCIRLHTLNDDKQVPLIRDGRGVEWMCFNAIVILTDELMIALDHIQEPLNQFYFLAKVKKLRMTN